MPGYQWAPAWVSWRYGGGYCGWAPLPPETFIGVEFGNPGAFHFGGDVDVSFGIGAGCYNFVAVGDFGERNYRGHFIDHSRNFAIINNTTNITNININRNNGGAGGAFRGVSVGGPQLSTINAHSRQHVQTVQLAAANQPGRSTLQGNTLAVYAPHVNAATVHQAKPTRVAQTLTHPTFNRGVSITKPMDVTASVKGTAPTPEAIQAAQTAQLHATSKAKIATEKTVPRTTLTQPLTSMDVAKPTHQVSNAAGPGVGAVNGANTFKPSTEQAAVKSPYTRQQAASTRAGSTARARHPAANSPVYRRRRDRNASRPSSGGHFALYGSGQNRAPRKRTSPSRRNSNNKRHSSNSNSRSSSIKASRTIRFSSNSKWYIPNSSSKFTIPNNSPSSIPSNSNLSSSSNPPTIKRKIRTRITARAVPVTKRSVRVARTELVVRQEPKATGGQPVALPCHLQRA